ncbi:cytochrome c3 family protein [Dokdonella sp. MW10]|uniref:cytochrome c3 family protein n=1 Tax=Dokdonella sp. MW10 TaxID=2992926 RepID=UPI003F80B668
MRWLIRRVLRKGKGSVSYEEDIHYGEVLTIGRASDQAIFLPDLRAALRHASVTPTGSGQYRVESLIIAGIRVDGQITYATTVGAGATIEIGTTRITLLEARQDYDAAVEVAPLDRSEQAAASARRAKPTSLSQTWLAKRWPSWIGFLAVLVFGLLLPMASHVAAPLDKALRVAPLPSLASWSSGELDAAHHFFGQDCRSCHENAFLMVRDTACTRCHAGTPAHADPARFNVPELGDARCATCHKDHNGTRGMIDRDQRLCADCHADLSVRTQKASSLPDIRDFGVDHPQFHVNLPAWGNDGRFTPKVTPWNATLKENSGLKFDHAVHLKGDGLNTPKGRKTLTCASCHTPEPGGAAMKPIAFETMCRECHALGFDTLAPDRQVPHANVGAVVYTLDEFYARRALEGGYEDARAPTIVRERRRPGSPPLSRQEQVEALAWARDRAREAARTLFTGKACVTCHSIAPPSGPDGDWRIAPVRVAGAWYTGAGFTHARHTTMACADCHAGAERSKASNDLLIPGIENCRQCHAGGEAPDGKLASTCIACHRYHQSDMLTLDRRR